MPGPRLEDVLADIVAADDRYAEEAYIFVNEALNYTLRMANGPPGGVSVPELLDGMRVFARREFGPVAKLVLNTWGIHGTDDFGEIVFNLVEKGVLGKSPEDRKEDFAGGYSFRQAFVEPYLPESARNTDTD